MGNVIINNALVEGPIQITYDPVAGYETIRTFRGPANLIQAQEAEFTSWGFKTEVAGGAHWSLVARIPLDARNGGEGTETPSDQWELQANTTEKDLLNADIPEIERLTVDDTNVLRAAIEGRLRFEDYATDQAEDLFHDPESAMTFYFMIASGVKSKTVRQPVLRKTQTVSNRYVIPMALYKVGHVWSTAKVQEAEAIPTSIAVQMQTSATSFRAENYIELFSGWEKQYPVIQVVARGRSQVVQEWKWGSWPVACYPDQIFK